MARGAGTDGPSRERNRRGKAQAMEYEYTTGAPITEEEASGQVAAMGFRGLAFDDVHDEDETLHWHEFGAVTWVISRAAVLSLTNTAM